MKILLLSLLLAVVPTQEQILEGLLNFLFEGQQQVSEEPRDEPDLLPEYDFIVVGAGTAGCVVANRLTENPQWKVLLIEAGNQENYVMDLPLIANYLQFTDSNWKYKTAKSDKYCLGMKNNQCNWPRGKVMGGSSVLNYMIYTRGNRRDYDHWAALGNEGWSYEDVLPYYKKVETFTIPEYLDEYHGSQGYLSVGYTNFRTNLSKAIIKANLEMGLNYTDYNGRNQVGVSYLHTSIQDGVRHSSNRAYLFPIRNRPNLHVRKLATVRRILFSGNRAVGVEFVRGGVAMTIRAGKEVVLCAGSINTPQLLMLSGVGPKKHLQSLGIPVLRNLKVGHNLMDHIAVGALTFTIDKPYTVNTEMALQPDSLSDYLNHHRGPISLAGGCEALTFLDTTDPTNPDGYPDIELLYLAGSVSSDPLLKRDFNIRDALYDSVYKEVENKQSFMIFPMLLRPKSKGRVLLKDRKYTTKPILIPNYFSTGDDIKVIVRGVKLALNVTSQPAMKALNCRLHDTPIPTCPAPFGTDEYWECMARHMTFTIYHLSGTCKMGPASDRSAVVDPRLRVHGMERLRVVDASIMPEVIAGHTNAPAYMIAEKGADLIKQDWGFI